jgi:hypothetical protein
MEYYSKRKAAREKVLASETKRLGDKLKFIKLVISGGLKLFGRSKAELRQDLTKAGFGSGYLLSFYPPLSPPPPLFF